MARIAFSFSISMASVPSGSDPEIRGSAGWWAASRSFRDAQRHLQSLTANLQSEIGLQGGEIGRRARLRIAKSSISERRFSLQSERVLRMEKQFSE
jgi:hypothetical protein